MFVATVGKFLFLTLVMCFLLTKAGNSSLCWHATFISISVCFLTYLTLNTYWHHNFQYIFCQNILWKQDLKSPVSNWGHPCQADKWQRVGENGPAIAQTQKLLNTQQVGPPCKLLPFQGNYNVGVRKKAMVFTRISACHAAHRVGSRPRGFPQCGQNQRE